MPAVCPDQRRSQRHSSTFTCDLREHDAPGDLVDALHAAGYKVAATDLGPGSRPIGDVDWAAEPYALVFGNERMGLAEEDMAMCDVVLGIPTNPDFGSLNLASAVQLVAYDWRQALGGFPSRGSSAAVGCRHLQPRPHCRSGVAPLSHDAIHIVTSLDGRPSGVAFVEFASAEEAKAAMIRDRQSMGTRYVELFPSSREEATRAATGGR